MADEDESDGSETLILQVYDLQADLPDETFMDDGNVENEWEPGDPVEDEEE